MEYIGLRWISVTVAPENRPTMCSLPTKSGTEPPWKCRRVLIQHRRIQHMSAPRKYDQEFRERAVRESGDVTELGR
jgi:hypothetical protein